MRITLRDGFTNPKTKEARRITVDVHVQELTGEPKVRIDVTESGYGTTISVSATVDEAAAIGQALLTVSQLAMMPKG